MEPPPRRDPRNQIAAGIFLAAFSAAGWWSALSTPALWSDEYGVDPGPGLLPALVLTLLSAGACGLVGTGLRGLLAQRDRPTSYWRELRRHTAKPTIFVASLLAYVSAIELIGFTISSFVLAVAWMLALGWENADRDPKKWLLQAIGGSIAGVGLIYLVFVQLIGVPL